MAEIKTQDGTGWQRDDRADAFPASEIGDEHAGDAIRGVGTVRLLWSGSLVSHRGKCAEVWTCFCEQQEKFCQHCLLRSKDSYAVSMSFTSHKNVLLMSQSHELALQDIWTWSRTTPVPVIGVPAVRLDSHPRLVPELPLMPTISPSIYIVEIGD